MQLGVAANDLEAFVEEHFGDEGHLVNMIGDKGKVTKTLLNARLKSLSKDDDPESCEERRVLKKCSELLDAELKVSKAVKDAKAVLDQKVLERYAALTESEIKTLAIEDKWLADIRTEVIDEVQALAQQLAGRVRELDERYTRPLPELARVTDELGTKVEGHLRRMGLVLS